MPEPAVRSITLSLADAVRESAFTSERTRLLLVVRRYGPFHSVADLAMTLGRDHTAISRDLRALKKLDLIETVRHGSGNKEKLIRAPYSQVFLLTPALLRRPADKVRENP